MSHTALRRVVIRMLHDPAFAGHVRADSRRALAAVELTDAERRWLEMVPAAAWRTDPARPGRVMAALREEFPASVSLAEAHGARFLQSPHFHRAVQERGSLALAFGEHLASAPDPTVRSLARLEAAIARVRRAPRVARPSAAACLRLAPHAALVRVAAGTVALLEARRHGTRGGRLRKEIETLLVLRAPSSAEVTIEEPPPALAALLDAAACETPRTELVAMARRQGAEPGEDAEVIDGLVRDGLLL